jgi:hypothetical protein
MDGATYLCKTDEVGEICVSSAATGSQYWGLRGLTNSTFRVQPLGNDGKMIGEAEYTRSGLLGFLGPVRTTSYFLMHICAGCELQEELLISVFKNFQNSRFIK